MDDSGKSWMALPRFEDQYMNGVDYFLDKAFERAAIGKRFSVLAKIVVIVIGKRGIMYVSI